MENILIFVAHDDDSVIGMGSTIMKYVSEKKRIIAVVFTYGEAFSPLMKKEKVVRMREKENIKVSKSLGLHNVLYLGAKDFNISSKDKGLIEKVKEIYKKYKPNRVFTHSGSDPHKDHQAVHKIILNALDKQDCEIFSFDVWNPITLFDTNVPRMYVDVSNTFEKKIKLINLFKSQKAAIISLTPNIYLKSRLAGNDIGVKHAEKFYKIK